MEKLFSSVVGNIRLYVFLRRRSEDSDSDGRRRRKRSNDRLDRIGDVIRSEPFFFDLFEFFFPILEFLLVVE